MPGRAFQRGRIPSRAIPGGVAVQTSPDTIGMALVKLPVLMMSPGASGGIDRIARQECFSRQRWADGITLNWLDKFEWAPKSRI
jgi:hypothetical protein